VTGPPDKGSPLFAASAQGETERSDLTMATVEGGKVEVNNASANTSTGSSGEPSSFQTVRGKPSPAHPFSWTEKRMLRRIRDAFDPTGDVALALATYTALAELASDCQSSEFTERKAVIAGRAGLSIRKLQDILHRLDAAKIIRITRRKIADLNIDGPSSYALLTESAEAVRVLPKERPSKERAGDTPTLEEVQAKATEIGMPSIEADNFFNYYTANGWRVGRNPMKSWPHALAKWKSNYEQRPSYKQTPAVNPRNQGVAGNVEQLSQQYGAAAKRQNS
jgi:hypothetical protein